MKYRINYKFIHTKKMIERIKVVSTPDLHISSEFNFENWRRLVKSISRSKPDLIVVPGDLIDSIDEVNRSEEIMNKALDALERLSKVAPVYYSMDWHDYLTKNGKKKKWEM